MDWSFCLYWPMEFMYSCRDFVLDVEWYFWELTCYVFKLTFVNLQKGSLFSLWKTIIYKSLKDIHYFQILTKRKLTIFNILEYLNNQQKLEFPSKTYSKESRKIPIKNLNKAISENTVRTLKTLNWKHCNPIAKRNHQSSKV